MGNATPLDDFTFTSDNTAPLCPEAMQALILANAGNAAPYGADPWVKRLEQVLEKLFERSCTTFLVFTGTAANALALSAFCRSYQLVVCHEQAHLEKDECSAPGVFVPGLKLKTIPGANGKIDLGAVAALLKENRGVHSSQPTAISVTQATELGTVYQKEELMELSGFAREKQLRLHMDGARLANALASTGCSAADMTWKCGVDVLSLGGVKAGAGLGEAIVVFDHALADGLAYRRKQFGQLASKMRYLAAPWVGALESGAWLSGAKHANSMAERIAAGAVAAGMSLAYPQEANGVFLHLSESQVAALRRERYAFHKFEEPDVYRFMCSWATEDKAVRRLMESFSRIAAMV